MAWQYSSPLGSALLAANGGQSETLGLGSTSIYKPYLSSYDSLYTRYQPRTNFFDRSLFDDLELELEVEDSLLSPGRYKPSIYNNQTSYVPSYFNSLKTSLNQVNTNYESFVNNDIKTNNFYSDQLKPNNDDSFKQVKQQEQNKQAQILPHQQQPVTYTDNLKKQTKTNNFKLKKNNAINPLNNITNNKQPTNNKKQVNANHPNLTKNNQPVKQQQPQQSEPNYQRLFQPMPFQQTPTIHNNINSVESSANIDGSINNHNNQQLRFLQYQQRLLQQQQQQQEMNRNENLSELELLKLKQQQDKNKLLQAIAANANKQYQPFYQDHQLRQKQYSETSIPSTNADPLNSNSPTPPLQHRSQKNNIDKPKPNNQNNLQAKKQQGFYYKLNEKYEDQTEPGSYLNTMRDNRIREQRLTKDKYTSQDYKQYQKNYGFGRDFLPFETETKKDKQEKARKREEYSKMIKERNTILMDGTTFNKFEKYNPTIYTLNDPVAKRNQATLNKVKN